jgi:hypothetical protein
MLQGSLEAGHLSRVYTAAACYTASDAHTQTTARRAAAAARACARGAGSRRAMKNEEEFEGEISFIYNTFRNYRKLGKKKKKRKVHSLYGSIATSYRNFPRHASA